LFKKNVLKRKLISLYGKIVREKATPEYIARGWAIGMFYGCLIPFGFQLLCSVPTALVLKGSKIGAVLGTLLTNHFTIFIIYPVQCVVGNRLIGGSVSYAEIEKAFQNVLKEQSYEALLGIGGELVAAFFVGGALLTLVTTPLTYWGVRKMVEEYQKRRQKKSPGKEAAAMPEEK